MKTSNEKLETFKEAEKERLKALHSEPYQVVIQLEGFPLPVRLTYLKEKSDRIIQIEELDSLERPETSCSFKGKSSIGTGCSYLKELKQAIQGMRPKDWHQNTQLITSYYKKH
jgi:hypothetical protein